MSPREAMGRSRRSAKGLVLVSAMAVGALALAPVATADSGVDPFAQIQQAPPSTKSYANLADRYNQLTELANSKAVQSTYNGSKLVGARKIELAPEGAMPKTNNRKDNPLLITGASYDHWLADRNIILDVESESMKRSIPLHVILPADPNVDSPTFYLLNGAGGGEDSANWSARTDIQDFFANDNVNVVTPMEGMFSYYTDWQNPVDDLHGENKWETFLTKELPSIMDQALETNGKNALAGLSMSGSSVLTLAEWSNPREDEQGKEGPLYQAVGAYSGCAQTGTFPGSEFVQVVTGVVGGVNVEDMWGPVGGEQWLRNDASLHADRLAGIPYVYVANGSGLPGEHDTLANPELQGNSMTLANQQIVGGGIELVTNACTWALKLETERLGLDNIDYNLKPTGTHSWGYWQDDLHISWTGIAKAIGATKADG